MIYTSVGILTAFPVKLVKYLMQISAQETYIFVPKAASTFSDIIIINNYKVWVEENH